MQPIQAHADLVCHVFSIQALINLICDVKTMEDAVMEMKYDSEKAPLGTMCFLNWGAVARWLERVTDDQVVVGSNPSEVAWKLWQFSLPFCQCLSEDIKSCLSLLSGVYARGSQQSHSWGKCVTCCGLYILAVYTTLIKNSVKVRHRDIWSLLFIWCCHIILRRSCYVEFFGIRDKVMYCIFACDFFIRRVGGGGGGQTAILLSGSGLRPFIAIFSCRIHCNLLVA